jgi:nucleoside-diphosphate-sugar epimerase
MAKRKMKKILITGGGGFIGTHLAERFSRDNQVVLFDNFHRDSLSFVPELKASPNVELQVGDVLDSEAVGKACRGADTVFHLAAIAGVSSYYQMSLKTLQVNVLGTVNVLNEAVRAGVKRVIHFSTSEVFGPDALWVTEESPHGIGPVSDRRWVYATSKLAGEHFVLRFSEEHGFDATVIRPFNIYGPRQVGEGAISNFCRAASRGEPIVVYGEGTAIRAWCYISDLVEAMELILAKSAAAGQVFNIGNPFEAETSLGLARRFVRLAPGAEIIRKEVKRSEVRARIPDIGKARKLLGFSPRVDLDEGIEKTLAWFRETGV